jgi:hypothetical protein
MTWWHRLRRGKEMEEQLEKELGFHLDQYTTDLIAQGQDPEEARRQARIVPGGPEQVKEGCRMAVAHAGYWTCCRTSVMPAVDCEPISALLW